MSESAPTFGKYQLLDRIAAGGMAEIFQARYSPAPGVTKLVVIKKILPHYAENKAFIAMFTNEARIAMGLSHGNIAQVFDFGAIDGDYFLAMELVDGQPLSKVLKRAKALGLPALPPQFAAFIASEMLKGLHYAHTRLDEQGRALQIVHRDVSPQNVLLSYESQVKLVDFGIARARNAGVEETNANNAVKGKYAYFAPEQARGKDLDGRTDVFAAGIVLYEMLVGQLPFQGRMMDVLSKIVRGQFPRPREVNRAVPVELERIVLKAMALDRAERYPTAEAFHQDLSKYLAQAHPDFSAAELALLLQLLFEEDLVAAGRPTQLPREFVERAAAWKQPLRALDDGDEPPTEMMPMPSEAAKPKFPATPGFGGNRGTAGRLVALTVAAVAVGVMSVFVATQFRKATLEVTSTPIGATVKLDGHPMPGVTPLTLPELEGGHRYKVEVAAPGFVPWVNDVPVNRGQRLTVAAVLIEQKVKPPEVTAVKAEPPVIEKASTSVPVANDVVTWPVGSVQLDVSRHHLELNAAGATVVKLDPSLTYRVSLSKGPTPGWAYYVVNDAGAMPVTAVGQPLQVKGASKLMAFHVPLAVLGARGREEARPRVLSLVAAPGKKAVAHEVPSALSVAGSTHVTLTGLSSSATYELTPRHGATHARIHPGAPDLQWLVMGTREGLTAIPFDQVTRVTNTEQVVLTVVDDGGTPTGLVDVAVREVPRHRR